MGKVTLGSDGNDVQNLASELKKYVGNKVKLAILTIGEQVSKSVADSTGKILALPFLAIAFIFLLVAFALFIGNILHSLILGFVVASGPCLFAGLLLYVFAPANISRKMQDKIAEKVIAKLDSNSNDIIRKSDTGKTQITNEKAKN